jgi:hypothetical protein
MPQWGGEGWPRQTRIEATLSKMRVTFEWMKSVSEEEEEEGGGGGGGKWKRIRKTEVHVFYSDKNVDSGRLIYDSV